MRIGLADIDPVIAAALLERLNAPPSDFLLDNIRWSALNPFQFQIGFRHGLKIKVRREPTEDERRAFAIRESRDDKANLRILAAVFGPILAGVAIGAATAAYSSPKLGIAVFASLWIAGSGAGIWWALRAAPSARMRHSLTLEEMRAAFPLLTLSRAERIYCDVLLLMRLIDLDDEGRQGARINSGAELRETLRQLNDLLLQSRQLEAKRKSILPLLGSHSVLELTNEYESLANRAASEIDTITHSMIDQSLDMCRSRLENARVIEQGLTRLNAQQEAVVQTLSTALSAIGRLQIMTDLQTDAAAQEISETISTMNRQATAVEQAVDEVLTLRNIS